MPSLVCLLSEILYVSDSREIVLLFRNDVRFFIRSSNGNFPPPLNMIPINSWNWGRFTLSTSSTKKIDVETENLHRKSLKALFSYSWRKLNVFYLLSHALSLFSIQYVSTRMFQMIFPFWFDFFASSKSHFPPITLLKLCSFYWKSQFSYIKLVDVMDWIWIIFSWWRVIFGWWLLLWLNSQLSVGYIKTCVSRDVIVVRLSFAPFMAEGGKKNHKRKACLKSNNAVMFAAHWPKINNTSALA